MMYLQVPLQSCTRPTLTYSRIVLSSHLILTEVCLCVFMHVHMWVTGRGWSLHSRWLSGAASLYLKSNIQVKKSRHCLTLPHLIAHGNFLFRDLFSLQEPRFIHKHPQGIRCLREVQIQQDALVI